MRSGEAVMYLREEVGWIGRKPHGLIYWKVAVSGINDVLHGKSYEVHKLVV